jgi:DNA-binding transcriptional MerR regulator
MESQYLTAADAAKILGKTPATVRLMNRRGVLPTAAVSASGVRFFDRATVEALAAERSRARATEPTLT